MDQHVHSPAVRNIGKGPDEKPCDSCGQAININAEICPKCGVRQKKKVSKAVLLLVTFFLGGFGVHKFYTKRNWQGVLYLIFCWTGIPGMIALIEFIFYAFTGSEKLQEKYEASGSGVIFGAAAAGFVFIFMAGILAAIAIPSFISFRDRSYQAQVITELRGLREAEDRYFLEHNKYSGILEEIPFTPVSARVIVEIISADEKCFEAKGRHISLNKSVFINCSGTILTER